MNKNIIAITVILIVFATSYAAFIVGKNVRQNEIEARIWHIQKDCYNEQDLEIIVFGEIQE
jgi:hypothetical protein